MTELPTKSMHARLRAALLFLGLIVSLFLTAKTRLATRPEVQIEGGTHFLDADCYARMTRVRELVEHGHWFIRQHSFENHPDGLIPHTTALLDWLLAALTGVFKIAGNSSALDLAGAWFGPLIALLCTGWLFFWAKKETACSLPCAVGLAAPLFFALSPVLAHGTAFGRPDHQALLLLLLALALAGEWQLADKPARFVGALTGLAWGLALWTSLYEPLVFFIIVVVAWLIGNPRAIFARERRPYWLTLLGVFGGSVLLDGWRVFPPPAEARPLLAHWMTGIGELRHLDLRTPLLWGWLGWLAALTPLLLVLAARRDRRMWAGLALWLAMLALTIWQVRWGYFLALVHALTLPWQLAVFRRAAIGWGVFAISLWPVFAEWEAKFYPSEEAQKLAELHALEQTDLRRLALIMREKSAGADGGFIAPWWLSPSIAYWSGLPGVAGSSHESIAGIADTARLYLAPTPAAAGEIARRRRVLWVVSDAPERLLEDSRRVLGIEPGKNDTRLFAERLSQAAGTHTQQLIPGIPLPAGRSPLAPFRLEEETILYRLFRVEAEEK